MMIKYLCAKNINLLFTNLSSKASENEVSLSSSAIPKSYHSKKRYGIPNNPIFVFEMSFGWYVDIDEIYVSLFVGENEVVKQCR